MSERLQRYLLWLLAVALVTGTGLALKYARGYRPAAVSYGFGGPPSGLTGDITLRFDNVRVVGRRDNRRAFLLSARRVETNRTRSRVDFSGGVEATLLDDHQRKRATFSSRQATYDAGGHLLVAAGQTACDVFPVSDNGKAVTAAAAAGSDAAQPLHFAAAEAVWNIGGHMVSCPGPVEVTMPGTTVRGEDLVVNLATREHTMKHFSGQSILPNEDAGSEGSFPAATALKGLIR